MSLAQGVARHKSDEGSAGPGQTGSQVKKIWPGVEEGKTSKLKKRDDGRLMKGCGGPAGGTRQEPGWRAASRPPVQRQAAAPMGGCGANGDWAAAEAGIQQTTCRPPPV